jgi:cytoskeletal protein CcmA (bactofilin family)
MFSKKSEAATRPAPINPMAGNSRNGSSTFSVLGNDVAIQGDIKADADLHLDGKVEGDVVCTSLVQGETGAIKGAVKAETARLAGKLHGSIEARELVILKTAQIEGDVHYETLTIEQGAQVDGRFAPKGASAPAGKPQPANQQDSEPQLKVAQ